MKPRLQLALDFIDLDRAVRIAEQSVPQGVDIIEVGTPLIKSEGLDAVRAIKENFPGHTIVADMKVMDTGSYEVEAAAKAGADIVVLLGVADDSTICEAIAAAHHYGCQIMVDLLNVEDGPGRARELEALGVDYICIHVGIDQQMRGVDPIHELIRVAGAVKTPLAIAGGLNSENVSDAIDAGASIIIIGGAITKAPDIGEATSRMVKVMLDRDKIKTPLYKKYSDPMDVFSMVSTANLADAMHRSGFMDGIVHLSGSGKLIGKAVTVRTMSGDWAKPVEAIDDAAEGDVIVIDAGTVGKAVWGELASFSAMGKGVKGVVIDGFARDIEEIRDLGFPVFARGVKSWADEPKGLGEINISVECGHVMVRPGDYIVGDCDGVVVISREKAVEVANRALDVFEKENRIRREIKEGSTLSRVLSLKKWEKK